MTMLTKTLQSDMIIFPVDLFFSPSIVLLPQNGHNQTRRIYKPIHHKKIGSTSLQSCVSFEPTTKQEANEAGNGIVLPSPHTTQMFIIHERAGRSRGVKDRGQGRGHEQRGPSHRHHHQHHHKADHRHARRSPASLHLGAARNSSPHPLGFRIQHD